MSQVPEMLTVLVNLVATGSSMLLLRRGSSRRLRRLILAVGIMSMAQLSVAVYSAIAGSAPLPTLYQALVGVMALYALYLLYDETRDRNMTDLRLRLAEHEGQARQAHVEGMLFAARFHEPVKPILDNSATEDLMALSLAIGRSVSPVRKSGEQQTERPWGLPSRKSDSRVP